MSETAPVSNSRLVGINEVCSGVYILKKNPPEGLVATGNFITAKDFGRAGEDAGKTMNYGQGVMRDIALQMVGIEAEVTYAVNGVEGYLMRGTRPYDLYQKIFYMMNNPDEIKTGSRNRLLLGTQLVHDVWQAGEGNFPPEEVPILGKVGHKIVSMIFFEEIEAREALAREESRLASFYEQPREEE